MSYGLGASIALASAPSMPRVPIVTAPRTVKPSIFVAPLKMMPVLLAPKIPVAPTTTVLKPSVLTAPAMSPTTPSVSIPSGATTGTSLVPSMSSGAPVEVGTIDKPKLSVGLIGLGLLALFLLSQDRR